MELYKVPFHKSFPEKRAPRREHGGKRKLLIDEGNEEQNRGGCVGAWHGGNIISQSVYDIINRDGDTSEEAVLRNILICKILRRKYLELTLRINIFVQTVHYNFNRCLFIDEKQLLFEAARSARWMDNARNGK